MYVYKQTENYLWTVGHYGTDGWEPESDWSSPEEAADRVNYLNGGSGNKETNDLTERLKKIEDIVYYRLPHDTAQDDDDDDGW